MNETAIGTRGSIAIAVIWIALASPAVAQTTPGTQQFSTRTDIVLADVTVIDGKGQPVLDLGLSDFALSVNGRARPIQAVEYVASSGRKPSAAASLEASRDGTGSRDGRYLLIVADEMHLGFGAGRAVLRSAENLVDRLAPEDRVAVVRLATGGSFEFTRDHAKAIQGLRGVTGRDSRRSRLVATVYPSEAVEVEDGGGPGWDAAVSRECGANARSGPCVDAMEIEARLMLGDMRSSTTATLRALEQLLKGLQAAAAPIHVVLISEGLFLDRSAPAMSSISSLAAAARVSMNIVRPAREWYDASATALPSNRSMDDQLIRGGLEQLAGELRGAYYNAIGDGSSAFDRIGAELAGYYLLAFEPTAEDRTGRDRRIKVEVKRRGMTVRSRSTFVIPSPSGASTRAADPSESPRGSSTVAATPPPATASTPLPPPTAPGPAANPVPVRVGTYSMFNPTDGRVRVLIAAEAGESLVEPSSWRVLLQLKDLRGQILSDSAATVSLSPVRAAAPSPALFSTEVVLEPGDYTFRLAMVGADGRVGMVDEKLSARFRPASGGFSVSDLVVVSEPDAGRAMRVTPTALVDRDRAVVFLEAHHPDAAVLNAARATFEIAQSTDSVAILTAQAASDDRANGRQRAFSASVPINVLPPGDYVMRGSLIDAAGTRSQFTKAFRVDRSRLPSSINTSGSRATRPPLMRTAAAVPPFALPRVLASDVVGTFIAELEQRHPSPSSAMTAFRAGLAELQASRSTQAMALFRQTLRAAPDFVGVAFFLGACYAATGQDREAIGAWQMSLLSKGANHIYPAIVDAMLRVGENTKALELLKEAPNAWPDASARARREAIARAATGDDEGALSLLITRLDDSKDAGLLFVGVQVMYRLYAERGLTAAERTTFANWTRQYEALGGADAALVRTWRDHVGR